MAKWRWPYDSPPSSGREAREEAAKVKEARAPGVSAAPQRCR
jgi:hypothetical protein